MALHSEILVFPHQPETRITSLRAMDSFAPKTKKPA